MSLGRKLREAHGMEYGLWSWVDRKLPSNPHGTLGGPTSRVFREDFCSNCWETKKKAWCLASGSEKEVENCMHIKLAKDLECMERYPSYAAGNTLSMLELPKRLALKD